MLAAAAGKFSPLRRVPRSADLRSIAGRRNEEEKPMTATTAPIETLPFQAETKQLLDIMIHSLYTNKEIFLRELISNASDALDRLRFESLTRPELLEDGDKLEIRLETDADDRTLTISDNGIGMSRQEVMDHIGTIARSGTRELRDKAREASSPQAMA